MKNFTVIGLWDDTGVVYREVVKATNPHKAMRIVASETYPPSQILCAIQGSHLAWCACEDSGKAAYAEDLNGGDNA